MTQTTPRIPPSAGARKVELDGTRKAALETGRHRLVVTGVVFTLIFAVLMGRVIDVSVLKEGGEPRLARTPPPVEHIAARAGILDRNGNLLATSLPTVSLHVNARAFKQTGESAEKTAAKLATVLPDLDQETTAQRLKSDRAFVYLHRNLPPKQQYEVNKLGIPALHFERQDTRVYPHGGLAAHILGLTDVDGNGIAGIEKSFDKQLQSATQPLRLSIDIRLQELLREELVKAYDEFKAIGGAGLIMDVNTGEVLAQVSLPDFDPNAPSADDKDAQRNRVTADVHEMGSTFKLITAAMALDNGTVSLTSRYDARSPIKVARFRIRDFHPQKRWLSVPEILVYSSNIGAAKMAVDVGTEVQKKYLRQLGLLDRPSAEIPEIAAPLTPATWREINTMTISYGHGIAVSPLQLATAISTIVNGGVMRPATFLKKEEGVFVPGEQVFTARTSRQMREMMRLVVRDGTGRKAEAAGYMVGGKTGTAEKQVQGSYEREALYSSFVGVFPTNDPKYLIFAALDEPKGHSGTYGYATGGWVGAPVVGRVVRRMAPLMGIAPTTEEPLPQPGDPLFIQTAMRR